jgi:hypothetical protein
MPGGIWKRVYLGKRTIKMVGEKHTNIMKRDQIRIL